MPPVQCQNVQRRLRGLLKVWEEGLIDDDLLSASIRGWVKHARHGNTSALRAAVLQVVPVEMRELAG